MFKFTNNLSIIILRSMCYYKGILQRLPSLRFKRISVNNVLDQLALTLFINTHYFLISEINRFE